MKKLFLLLAAGVSFGQVGAQQSHSVVFTGQHNYQNVSDATVKFMPTTQAHGRNARTTDGTSGEWFSFVDANLPDAQGTVPGGFLANFPDSTLYVPNGNPNPFYWWCHGVGTSFDAKSTVFNLNWANNDIAKPSFAITAGNAYTVDSIQIVGKYLRRNASFTDTLFIEVVASTTPGTYEIQSANPVTTDISEDGTLRVADATYNNVTNSIDPTKATGVIRMTKILDQAAYNDSLSNGLNFWNIEIPGGLQVPAGGNVVAYTHFGPQFHYALGALIDTANYFSSLSYDLGITPLQRANDHNGGLYTNTQDRYRIPGRWTQLPVSGDSVALLSPTYFLTSPVTAHDPYFSFHIKCPGCPATAIASVNKGITANSVYPNPAINKVNVEFTLKAANDVTVSMTNIIGQVVKTQSMKNVTGATATFVTSDLANGVYMYTIHAGNETLTGRIVVAH